jgi:uncharacterized protein YhaN
VRFRALTLEAFGPFTSERLDLSGGAPGGLHIVYGPNEAGKSTSLRAVTGLLFGIPERTGDAHLHPAKNLAVDAVLERTVGGVREELSFSRRKRRKDSLVDQSGNALPEGTLDGWLHGLDERSFLTRFGLDQARLELGAEALLGGSEEGLFAAGTAGADVRRLLEDLDEQSGQLYLPRGSKPRLNRALSALSEASKAVRMAVRPPEKWREQKKAHELAVERVRTIDAERQTLRADQKRLSRLASVLSDVSRWVDTSAERKALGALPDLGPDATERRERAEREARELSLDARRLERELSDIQKALAALPAASSLSDVEDERLASLQMEIGREFKAQQDLPKLQLRMQLSLEEIRRVLAGLGHEGAESPLERADSLAVEAALERRVRRLAAEHGKLWAALEQSERLTREVSRELEGLRAALESAPHAQGLEGLELALGNARRAERDEERLASRDLEERKLRAKVERLRTELGTSAPLSELVCSLPTAREVERARAEHASLLTELRRVAKARAEQKTRLDGALAGIGALASLGEVPTEARLADARKTRDEAHSLVVAAADVPEEVRSRALELASREQEADRIADRLRLEAHRVSELKTLEEARLLALSLGESLAEESKRLEGARAAFDAKWRAAWERLGVSAAPPDDFVELRQRLHELSEQEESLGLLSQETSAARAQHASAREALVVALRPFAAGPHEAGPHEAGSFEAKRLDGASLGSLLEVGARLVTESKEARERRRAQAERQKELERTLVVRKAESEDARHIFEEWRREWGELVPKLGLSVVSPPEEALAVLSDLAGLLRLSEDAREKQRRVRGIERDSAAFVVEVRALVEKHAPDLTRAGASEAAEELLRRVRTARDADKERRRLEAERALRSERLAAAEAGKDAASATLEAIMRLAGARDAEELPRIEGAVKRARELDAQLERLEESLRSKAGAGSLLDLIEEARSIRHDELLAQLEEVERRLEELEEELRNAQHDAASLELGLERFRGEEAAVAQQRVETVTAEAREALRQFVVLRAARLLLEREVTRYAERHQGPVLSRASEHFPRLTLGKYTGLRVGLGERTLRCVRDGRELEVSELSRGTRAQLYLALRLASLEHHFEHHSPVPLVFDDLFVDFDDDRAAAAFELLGELATRVQILYFTHLGRDLQAARDAVPRGTLFEHRIGVDGVSWDSGTHLP